MINYEIKINYTRQTGEDNPAGVKETYLVEGITCADVENRLLEEINNRRTTDAYHFAIIVGECFV